jgi:hypothetical protein
MLLLKLLKKSAIKKKFAAKYRFDSSMLNCTAVAGRLQRGELPNHVTTYCSPYAGVSDIEPFTCQCPFVRKGNVV